jgi:hypothetical protein
VAAALTIATLSRVPTVHANEGEAMLRLSWRLRGARIEQCRQRTPEELEALAPHMRSPEVCVGANASYELNVKLDGREVVRDTVHPGGVRADRPVYVFQELRVSPGTHLVEVKLAAILPEAFDPGGAVVGLALAERVRIGPAEIALVTLDSEGTRLVVRTP